MARDWVKEYVERFGEGPPLDQATPDRMEAALQRDEPMRRNDPEATRRRNEVLRWEVALRVVDGGYTRKGATRALAEHFGLKPNVAWANISGRQDGRDAVERYRAGTLAPLAPDVGDAPADVLREMAADAEADDARLRQALIDDFSEARAVLRARLGREPRDEEVEAEMFGDAHRDVPFIW